MTKAGDLLSSFLDGRLYNAAKGYSELFSSWRAIAGDNIAAHSRIAELDKCILLVEADHPGWIQILQTKQADLLERLRRRFPELTINGISFRLSRELRTDTGRGNERKEGAVGSEDAGAEASVSGEGGKEAAAEVPAPAAQTAPEDPYERIADESFRDQLKRLEKSIERRNTPR